MKSVSSKHDTSKNLHLEGETKREHADIEPDLKIQLNELWSSKANSKRVVIKNVLMKYGLADDIMKGKLIINSYSINFLIDNSSKLENVKDNSQNSKQDEIYDKDKKYIFINFLYLNLN